MSIARNARWWALDYAAAVRWQLGPLLRHHDPAAYLRGRPGMRPVVVLPGIWETWRFLLPLIERIHRAGHPVHAVTALRANGATVDSSAEIVAGYLADHDLDDVLVVAHSKGGLIGKQLMLRPDSGPRVRAMLAISTPFSGSAYAPYLLLRSLRAFSPTDPTTVRLKADRSVDARITSVWAAFDPHIPVGSELAGAVNRRIDDGGHFRILRNPQVLAEVDRFVAAF
ncbi:esterase/lipase family protein [uncultured Amnibacterium sp.]|uniref:esterase/lipase family protein n=1 Tax=uncultured Amnibacterium sp. TaxID=1631851 RepID=UPI0035CC3980